MKKLLLLTAAALMCLTSCTNKTDKVAETYFKTVVSQQASNADQSLAVVTPLDADSVRNGIIEYMSNTLEREMSAFEYQKENKEDFTKSFTYQEGDYEKMLKETEERIELLKAKIEEAKTVELPQYYSCSYDGSHYEYVTTDAAVNADDFTSQSLFFRKTADNLIKESK